VGASLQYVDPDLRNAIGELSALVYSAGAILTITSTVRSAADQDFLWMRYRKGQSPLPAAPPGHSAHEYGWAVDAVVSPDNLQYAVGRAWEKYWGGKWGGPRDPVHFEIRGASQLAWKLGELQAQTRPRPTPGGSFYKLADFLSSFVPGLGEVQLVDTLVTLLDHNDDLAGWYLQHPAEAIRDLIQKVF